MPKKMALTKFHTVKRYLQKADSSFQSFLLSARHH